MDGESYEDPGVAETLNRDFVCIKVDRDERPDVDTRYQRAVQALTGQGGWPLTAFLTPEGEVFFGGTYFPPEENHYGRPGFRSVLSQVAGMYRQQRDQVAENAKAIRRHVVESLDEAKSGEVTPATLERAAGEMARLFDIRYGGFGTAPKFPHPAAVQFLLARWHDTRADWMREVVEKTLIGMAKGGARRAPIRPYTSHVARSRCKKPERCSTTRGRTCCGASSAPLVTMSGRDTKTRSGSSRRPGTTAKRLTSTPHRTSTGTP